MREIRNKFIITFPTTLAAIAMESHMSETGTPGRLIPVPSSISAGCGMCWACDPADEEACRKTAEDSGLEYESFCNI